LFFVFKDFIDIHTNNDDLNNINYTQTTDINNSVDDLNKSNEKEYKTMKSDFNKNQILFIYNKTCDVNDINNDNGTKNIELKKIDTKNKNIIKENNIDDNVNNNNKKKYVIEESSASISNNNNNNNNFQSNEKSNTKNNLKHENILENQIESDSKKKSTFDTIFFVLIFLNFTTRGIIATYESQSARILLDKFHLTQLQLGLLVSISGFVGTLQLIFFKNLWTFFFSDMNLMIGRNLYIFFFTISISIYIFFCSN
jgi:hypothetical protein